jgi:hypothetical protein
MGGALVSRPAGVVVNTRWIEERIDYDGSQLRPHWILSRTGQVGDALVAFLGACDVADDEMADLADLQAGSSIAADDMVHLLWESFEHPDLLLAVHRQRLLAAQAAEVLRELTPRAHALRRSGDDLYLGDAKLSVSVATVSPVSSLIHFGVNAAQGGAPVRIAALADFGVAPRAFAESLMARVAAEQDSIRNARAVVRGKGGAAR